MSEQFVSKPWLVIPCYNEAGRLDEEQLVSLTQQMRVLLVDDGSTDSTYSLLTQLQDKSNGLIEVLQLHSVRVRPKWVMPMQTLQLQQMISSGCMLHYSQMNSSCAYLAPAGPGLAQWWNAAMQDIIWEGCLPH